MKNKSKSLILTLMLVITISTNVFAANTSKPNINGKNAVTMDLDTGEIIYEQDIDGKVYPASTTKLMTALLLAENKKKEDLLSYTKEAKAQPAYSLGLNIHNIDIGETMTANDVMDSLLLYSGNDIAYMIADNVSGNSNNFMQAMNEKAAKLGLKNTHFVTPNGLHDPDHYTTAYELTLIARAAYSNPWVKESMNKKTSTVKTSKGTIMIIENRNKLLGKDGCVGGKTGYTSAAGRCLVAIYERDGRTIVGAVMKSVYDRDDSFVFKDMEDIINWSYSAKKTVLHPKDSVLKTKTVSYKPLRFFGPTKTIDIPLIVDKDVVYYDNAINKNEKKEVFNVSNIDVWDLSSDKPIGTFSLNERQAKKSYDLYTTISKSDIIKENVLLYSAIGAATLLFILVLLLIIKIVKNKKRKNRRGKYI